MTQDNFDLLNEVPEVQSGFPQYGKLSLGTKLMVWRDKKLEESSRDEFMRAEKSSRAIDMRFIVAIREFKPQLDFDYDRKVRVGGLDWQKTLAPSVEALLGKGTMASDKQNATVASLNGKYVKVIDVPEQQTKKQREDPNAKVYSTVKFLKVYESREACLHDASEGFAGTASNGNAQAAPSDPWTPADYSTQDWASMKQDIVDAVSAAVSAAEKQTRGKPKPVIAKAMESAKSAAIELKASELAATPEQVLHLLNS